MKDTKIISVLTGKGGAGKTTVAVNLAWCLHDDYNKKTVIIDLDKDKPDAYGWKEQAMESGIDIFDVDTHICENSIKELLDSFKNKYEYIVIDTPPNFQSEAFKATLVSDLIVIPSSPSLSDQKALVKSIEIADSCSKPYKMLAVRVQKRHNLSQQLIDSVADLNGFKTFISLRSAIMESQFFGKWIGRYKNNSDAHNEFKALTKEVLNILDK